MQDTILPISVRIARSEFSVNEWHGHSECHNLLKASIIIPILISSVGVSGACTLMIVNIASAVSGKPSTVEAEVGAAPTPPPFTHHMHAPLVLHVRYAAPGIERRARFSRSFENPMMTHDALMEPATGGSLRSPGAPPHPLGPVGVHELLSHQGLESCVAGVVVAPPLLVLCAGDTGMLGLGQVDLAVAAPTVAGVAIALALP